MAVAVFSGIQLAIADGAFDDAGSDFDTVLVVKVAAVGLLIAGAIVARLRARPEARAADPRRPSSDDPQAARRCRLGESGTHADGARARRGARPFIVGAVRQDPSPMQYAFFGEAKTESLDRFAKLLGKELEQAGFNFGDGDPREANLVLSLVEPDEAKPFRRGARGTYVLAVFERPEHPEPIEESLRADYPMLLRALANLVLDYVPGEGAWFTTMERGHYGVSRGLGGRACEERHRAARAARQLAPDHRQRVQDRPRARAVGGRRDHRVDPRRRRPARRPQPPAEPVPHRGSAHRARAAAREAALRHRRAVLRQPLGPQGRRPLLDERERGRQDEARHPRPRHPARLGLRRRERPHGAERAAGRGAAARVRRRHRALDDLPGAPRRRRHRPRARLGGRDRCDGRELPLRHGGARARGRRPRSRRGRSRQRNRRPAQPRHHRHRPEPGRDPRPHRAEGSRRDTR